ncbi:helix-turn-helix domain-containing protein [Streptomyces sp. RKAG337]|uniref:helix-turn-helix domain-containing protein n=1 Tax=Streptomyces sp. RKAG337 TaxID=2893404 RepID=UPI002033B711|nr:helix-turn-helix transcriptional regulator [Streptomyces sp. RKAG337]MCM2427637.1 helix-turn-helix domain-containing protein [Streptomyces sp. RKAG337]
MPARDVPTARQVRLGTELRKMRDRAGKTAREAAGLLGNDQAKISHMESGRIGISEERIRRLAAFYSCDDETLIDALCAIAKEQRGQGWWDEYRGVLPPGFVDIAELEHHATYLRSLQALTLPGLFQTEDYARTIFAGGIPRMPESEVAVRVEHRLRRRAIFQRVSPPSYEAIIHEAALRMRFGGVQITCAQLEHLLEVAHWPTVTVRVIPFTNETFIEATQTVLYAGGIVAELDTVQIDSPFGGYFLDSPAQLDKYRAFFNAGEKASLDPKKSISFIRQIARELRD